MILQNLVFPKENICNEPELYFHGTTDGKICLLYTSDAADE